MQNCPDMRLQSFPCLPSSSLRKSQEGRGEKGEGREGGKGGSEGHGPHDRVHGCSGARFRRSPSRAALPSPEIRCGIPHGGHVQAQCASERRIPGHGYRVLRMVAGLAFFL